MNNELLCFHATEMPASAKPPQWIMYAPGGQHSISAKLGGKTKTVKVMVDEATAEALQRDLLARRATGGPQPYFDFFHEAREASGYPEEFSWRDNDDTVGAGVYCRVTWTPKGAEAVTCGAGQKPTVRYFSPRAHYEPKQGRITGLMDPEHGSEAGGLVPDPAFTAISPLTAGKAVAQATQPNNEDMNPKLIAALAASGLLTADEAKADNAHELLASRAKELKDKADKPAAEMRTAELKPDPAVEDLKKELAAMKGKAADRFVNELVASGKIPPKAEGMKKMWRTSFLTDDTQAEADAKELKAGKALDAAPLTDDNDRTGAGDDDGGMSIEASKAFYQGVSAKQSELLRTNKGMDADTAWRLAEGELKAARASR